MSRRFQFSVGRLLGVDRRHRLLLGICRLSPDATAEFAGLARESVELAFSVLKILVYSAFLFVPLVLLFLPACGFAHKLGQCLLGRLPPDELADAEPIRFDSAPGDDDSH